MFFLSTIKLDISFNIVGKGTPIIFIHGIGSRKYSWNGVIEELKDQYQCISYDLRGHGESKFDKSEFTLKDLVDDIEKLRSHLNIHKSPSSRAFTRRNDRSFLCKKISG